MAIITKDWESFRSRDPIKATCDNCRKLITRNKHRFQDSLLKTGGVMFCSRSCSIEYRTEYIEGVCETCTLPIKRCLRDWEKTNHHFCSSRCAALYSNKNSLFGKRGPKPTKPKKITKKINRNGDYIKIELACLECGAVFNGYKSRKYCSRECSGKNAYKPNSTRVHRSEYCGFQLDSGAELYFAKEMDLRNVRWLKNDGKKFTKFFEYADNNGKIRKYYPDFYLTEYNVWVEIKGRKYQSENDHLKLAAIDAKSYYLISNEFRETIPTFFLDLENYRHADGGRNGG